jgi:hypothetical protein
VQPPAFKQITFSRGEVGSALFAPDGQTIVYSAGWEGKPFEVFINRPRARSRGRSASGRRGARDLEAGRDGGVS